MSNNYLAEPKSAPKVNASCNALLQFFKPPSKCSFLFSRMLFMLTSC